MVPRATLDDIYNQNETIIGLLERLNQNTFYLREAVYGQTSEEAGRRFENPKHGHWGSVDSDQFDDLITGVNDLVKALDGR